MQGDLVMIQQQKLWCAIFWSMLIFAATASTDGLASVEQHTHFLTRYPVNTTEAPYTLAHWQERAHLNDDVVQQFQPDQDLRELPVATLEELGFEIHQRDGYPFHTQFTSFHPGQPVDDGTQRILGDGTACLPVHIPEQQCPIRLR